VSYDPKAKRPIADDPVDAPAPVDQLLGAAAASSDTAGENNTEPAPRTAPEPVPLPHPVQASRTPKAIAGALVAVAIVLLGWRRYRR
jgi:hypothetical protein